MNDEPAPIDWTGQKKISLALQGGGSHGAFTWGVLDAILEDGRLDVEAITGTSAGAMNAVVFAEGYLEGGREGARKSLAKFWRSISDEGAFTPAQQKFVHLFFQDWPLQANLAYWWSDFLTHYSSPYDFNPLNINPLRDHLVKTIDFEKVRACEEVKLFVSATNVHNGRVAVFERHELSADHVMASACLPFLFQAVEIAGVPYWDGGYMGNPALFPLFYKTGCRRHIDRADQSDRAHSRAENRARHSGPAERDHVQWRVDGRIPRHGFRQQADRQGQAFGRRIHAHAAASHRWRRGARALRRLDESAGVLDHDRAVARFRARRREGMARGEL